MSVHNLKYKIFLQDSAGLKQSGSLGLTLHLLQKVQLLLLRVTSWITKTHSHLIYLRHQSLSLVEWVDFPDAFLTELKSVCRTQTSPHPHCTTPVRASSGHWARLLPTLASLPSSLRFPESQLTHLTQAGTGEMEISWLLAASPEVYPYTEG